MGMSLYLPFYENDGVLTRAEATTAIRAAVQQKIDEAAQRLLAPSIALDEVVATAKKISRCAEAVRSLNVSLQTEADLQQRIAAASEQELAESAV